MKERTTMNSKQDCGQKMVLEEMELYPKQRSLIGKYAFVSCDTVGDLSGSWLQDRQCVVKKSTYSAYSYCVKAHIMPFWGNISISALDRDKILSFMDQIRGKGLADTTIHFIFMIFKFILKYGIHHKLVKEEAMAYCSATCHRTESKVLTVQDSIRMKDYLLEQNTIFSVAILLCRGTGIRIGELCGLRWEDIDFVTNTFSIKRTVSRIPNPDISEGQPKTILYIRTPKSHTSSRVIPIPEYLIDSLRRMRKSDGLYLLTGRNTCTEPRNVQKKFKTILRHCEMQDCNFHAMRHGFATACLENGIDCKTVSSILGHASTRTTMDFYLHTSMRQKKNCINAID